MALCKNFLLFLICDSLRKKESLFWMVTSCEIVVCMLHFNMDFKIAMTCHFLSMTLVKKKTKLTIDLPPKVSCLYLNLRGQRNETLSCVPEEKQLECFVLFFPPESSQEDSFISCVSLASLASSHLLSSGFKFSVIFYCATMLF